MRLNLEEIERAAADELFERVSGVSPTRASFLIRLTKVLRSGASIIQTPFLSHPPQGHFRQSIELYLRAHAPHGPLLGKFARARQMWIVLNYLQRQLAHSNSHTSEVRKNLTDLYVLALLYHSRRACDLNTETSEEETDRFPRYATAVWRPWPVRPRFTFHRVPGLTRVWHPTFFIFLHLTTFLLLYLKITKWPTQWQRDARSPRQVDKLCL
jgi:hypothetical protein